MISASHPPRLRSNTVHEMLPPHLAPLLSHPLTDASQTLDAALEEPDAALGPIPSGLEGVKQALVVGAGDPIELNAGVDCAMGNSLEGHGVRMGGWRCM